MISHETVGLRCKHGSSGVDGKGLIVSVGLQCVLCLLWSLQCKRGVAVRVVFFVVSAMVSRGDFYA